MVDAKTEAVIKGGLKYLASKQQPSGAWGFSGDESKRQVAMTGYTLMAFQADRAEQCYAEAFALLPREDRKAQRPGLVMAAIYRTLLTEIRRDGFRVLNQRTALTPVRKLWIAWKTWITA